MDLGIEGRNAIVCASRKGLGKACALALAREGANVWICGRTERTLVEAAEEIEAGATGSVEYRVADVTSEAQVSRAFAEAARPAISATGAGRTGSRRSTTTCSAPST